MGDVIDLDTELAQIVREQKEHEALADDLIVLACRFMLDKKASTLDFMGFAIGLAILTAKSDETDRRIAAHLLAAYGKAIDNG